MDLSVSRAEEEEKEEERKEARETGRAVYNRSGSVCFPPPSGKGEAIFTADVTMRMIFNDHFGAKIFTDDTVLLVLY